MSQVRSQDFSGFQVYAFGEYRLDTRARLLTRDGAAVPLPPKAFDLLVALVQSAGLVVMKQELLDRVWPGTFVEEANLPQNISLVRKALDESPKDHRFIVTVPGSGYRFAATVTDGTLTAPAPAPNSVAVLPFRNVTGDPSLDYLADGLTEGLISALSNIGRLQVKARAVVFRMKPRDIDPQQAGRDLSVAHVIVGRVMNGAVTLEIVESRTGYQTWSGQFGPLSDSLKLQDTMARDVAARLRITLTSEEQARIGVPYTASTPAYQCYMKGRYFLNKRLTETLGQALAWFREATDHDPGFALAYVGMADTYALQSLYGSTPPRQAFPLSIASAREALRIDPDLAEAHNSLGVASLFYDWDGRAAEAAFSRAIALDPSYAEAHQRLGMFFTTRARFDEARQALATAQALDPLSLITSTIAAYPDYYERRFASADEQLRRVLALDHGFSMAHFRLGLSLMAQHRFYEARAELLISQRLSGDPDVDAALGRLAALEGQAQAARRVAADLEVRAAGAFVTPYALATIHAALGDRDAAFAWLERAVNERSYWLIYAGVDPALDSLRDDPRFRSLPADTPSRPGASSDGCRTV